MTTAEIIISIIAALMIGFIAGILFANYLFKKRFAPIKKQLESVDKEQVKNMLNAMGKKPSEEQVNRILGNVEKMKTKKEKKAKPSGKTKTSKKKRNK